MLKIIVKWVVKTIIGRIVSMAVLAGVLAGVLFFLAQGITDASLDRLELYDIKDITTDSFTMAGEFFVNNPSKLPIPIKSVDYEIILKETGETISTGYIPATFIGVGESSISFEQRIKWVPAAELALELVTKEHVYVIVEGEIRIDLPRIEAYALPFSKEMDIKDYVRQFTTDKLPIDTGLPETGLPSGPNNSGGNKSGVPNLSDVI